jgi:ribose 5-phosphate isomerase B
MILIASDHAGYDTKEQLKKFLKENNYEVEDLGTNSKESVDYPDFAIKLANRVIKEKTLGILICGTGIGMSIACNKVKGIRCAKVSDELEAKLCKEHNNANVIALSSRLPQSLCNSIVKIYLETPFSNDERHIRRLDKISKYECQ